MLICQNVSSFSFFFFNPEKEKLVTILDLTQKLNNTGDYNLNIYTFTSRARIGPLAIAASLSTVSYQNVISDAVVIYPLAMLYHITFISCTFDIKAIFWWSH